MAGRKPRASREEVCLRGGTALCTAAAGGQPCGWWLPILTSEAERKAETDGISDQGVVAMGWESQPREVCRGRNSRSGDQAQSRPGGRRGVAQEQRNFFQLLGAAGEGREAQSPDEYRSEVPRHAVAVLDPVPVGGRGDDGAAIAGCRAAGVAGDALFYSGAQRPVFLCALRAAAAGAGGGRRGRAVARAARPRWNPSTEPLRRRGAIDFSYFCFGTCVPGAGDAGDRGVRLGAFCGAAVLPGDVFRAVV